MEYKLVLLHWYKILVSYHIKYLTRPSKAHRLFPSLLEGLPVLAIDNYYDFNQPFISRSNLLESLGIYLRNSPTRFPTKVGFRAIASSVFDQEKTLPQGFICRNQQKVRNAVEWFTSRSYSYVINGSDRGIIFLEANSLASDDIVSVLALGRTQNEAIAYLSQLKNKLPSPNA